MIILISEHSHVIPALIRKFDDAAQNSKPFVEVWGNRGSGVSREFLYAGDLAEVLAKAAVSSFNHPEPINIGTGVETTIDSLIELIARMTGFRGEVRYNGKLDGQPKRVLNVDRAKELLGLSRDITRRRACQNDPMVSGAQGKNIHERGKK